MLQEEQDSARLQVDALLTRCGELLTKLQASSKKVSQSANELLLVIAGCDCHTKRISYNTKRNN